MLDQLKPYFSQNDYSQPGVDKRSLSRKDAEETLSLFVGWALPTVATHELAVSRRAMPDLRCCDHIN
jgi:hypothetical protein